MDDEVSKPLERMATLVENILQLIHYNAITGVSTEGVDCDYKKLLIDSNDQLELLANMAIIRTIIDANNKDTAFPIYSYISTDLPHLKIQV